MRGHILKSDSHNVQDEYIVQRKNQFKIEGLYIILGVLCINVIQGFIRDALSSHVILSLLILLFFASYYMIRGAFSGTEYPNVASRNKYKQKRRELTVYTTITYIIFLALSIGDKFFFHPNKEWLDIFAVSTIFLILLLLINYFSVKKSYEKNQDIGDD